MTKNQERILKMIQNKSRRAGIKEMKARKEKATPNQKNNENDGS